MSELKQLKESGTVLDNSLVSHFTPDASKILCLTFDNLMSTWSSASLLCPWGFLALDASFFLRVWLVFRHYLLKWAFSILFLLIELPLHRWLAFQAALPIGRLDDCLITYLSLSSQNCSSNWFSLLLKLCWVFNTFNLCFVLWKSNGMPFQSCRPYLQSEAGKLQANTPDFS